MSWRTRAAIIISFLGCLLVAAVGVVVWVIVLFPLVYTIVGTAMVVRKGYRWFNDLPNSFRVLLAAVGGWVAWYNLILGVVLVLFGVLLNDEPLRRTVRQSGVIVLSGVDGTGKSTWTTRICEELRGNGYKCRIIRFYRYLILSQIRKPPSTEGLSKTPPRKRSRLFFLRPYLAFVDNFLLYLTRVFPANWRGEFVVCDRFIWDNYVKHRALGYRMWRILVLLIKPKHGIILDVSPRVSRQRTDRRDFHYEYSFDELEQERRDFSAIGRQLGYPVISTEQSQSKTWKEITAALVESGLPLA
jgi:thymidylate kinase